VFTTLNHNNTTIRNLNTDIQIRYDESNVTIKDKETKVEVEYLKKESTIFNNHETLTSTYNNSNSTISWNDGQVSSVINTINVGGENKILNLYNVDATYASLENYANLEIAQTTNYIRNNVYKTTGSINNGYGVGWDIRKNSQTKQISVMDIIETPTQDNFYSSFYLYYSSSRDIVSQNFYSSSLTSSKTRNQENLSIGVQNHRFIGSKLIGPDINVNTRNSPDGKPVVEVNSVGSTQIYYNTYFDRGNLVVK
jgi:hypothetical protein